MRVIASYNIKGGVGKTASSVNLAYLAAEAGQRVLLWDLDPQGAASFYFRVKPKVKGGLKGILKKKESLDSRIKATDYENLDLMPADFTYRSMDLRLEGEKKPTRRIAGLLKPLRGEYDIVFLDCPPSISLVSQNVLRAADAILAPTVPTTLSFRAYEQLEGFRKDEGLNKLLMLPFFSMVDRRRKLHRDVIAQARGGGATAKPGAFLATDIPYASDIERMGVHRAPLPSYAPRSRLTNAYRALWEEIGARFGLA